PRELGVEDLIAPRAQSRRPVDALQEIGDPTPAAGGEDGLIDVVHALAHGFQGAPSPALEVAQPISLHRDDAVARSANRREEGLLVLLALAPEELRVGVLVAWALALLQGHRELELRQVLAGEEPAQVRGREEELVAEPLHDSVRELESQGRQRRVEAPVVATDGPDPRVRDRAVARALEDRPVLVVVAEA